MNDELREAFDETVAMFRHIKEQNEQGEKCHYSGWRKKHWESVLAVAAEVTRLRAAVNLPAEWHTCGHHPHLGCAACEVIRRAKEG